jgi:uncharacterized membrane protein
MAAIGLFAWALAANIVFQVRAPEMTFYHITYWTTIVALCTGGVAWLVWMADYLTTARTSDAFGMASAYTLLHLGTLACYFAAFLIMIIAGATTGNEKLAILVLEAVGAGLLPLAWWIGDEMLYRHHIGMIPDTPAEAEAERMRHSPRGEFISQH